MPTISPNTSNRYSLQPGETLTIVTDAASTCALYRRQKFPEIFRNEPYNAEEQIILVSRAILESRDNSNALVEPVVHAVSACARLQWTRQGLRWIEAFDHIPLVDTLKTLVDLFGEKAAAEHLPVVLCRKLWQFFGPDVAAAKPVKVNREKKPPAKITRVAGIEKRIAFGKELLELKAQSRRNNEFAVLRRKKFPNVEAMLATEAARVARTYGERPDIYQRLSWAALVELASPSLPAAAREQFERRALGGEDVKGAEIVRARGRLPSGRPRQERPATRMAA